ncbi:MAG TPA: response regulator [Burkholderiales bacterium]|nr:response regulator [Burkholderiales bacterium]
MIILVEDDGDQRLALKVALELAGYTVREASNGRVAMALLNERPPLFLITDIFMPETDGFELIGTVRERSPQTRIIVVSGGGRHATLDYLAAAELIGVDATLQKPFPIPSLLETLAALTNGARGR